MEERQCKFNTNLNTRAQEHEATNESYFAQKKGRFISQDRWESAWERHHVLDQEHNTPGLYSALDASVPALHDDEAPQQEVLEPDTFEDAMCVQPGLKLQVFLPSLALKCNRGTFAMVCRMDNVE
jgi:hypothetical protein